MFLARLSPYFRQVAGGLVVGSVCGFVMNTALVLPGLMLGRALDRVLAIERGTGTRAAALAAALVYVLSVLLAESARAGKRWWLGTSNTRFTANLRADAFAGILAMPPARLDRTPVGELMARLGGDLDLVARGVRELTVETWDTLTFSVASVAALVWLAPRLTLYALAPVPVAMLLAKWSGRWIARRTGQARAVAGELTGVIQEHLTAVRVLRLFGRSEVAERAVARLSRAYADANLGLTGLRSALAPLYGALMTSGVVVVIGLGGRAVVAGAMTVGAFVGYVEVFGRFVGRAHRVPQLMNALQSASAAFARFGPLLAPALPLADEPPHASFDRGHLMGLARPPPPPPARAPRPAAVTLAAVRFTYPAGNNPVINDLSLEIPPGAFVAITGPVGSGKTTLARLIAGLRDPDGGTVLVDGQPATAIERDRLGFAPQGALLFSGTVLENLLWGEEPTAEARARAGRVLELAQLAPDVAGFPAGVDTAIGELGIRLSGGQRQRLALARALISRGAAGPDLLVLDDPFSAVDVDTEARIVATLREAVRGATLVLFSHRLAAFPHADRVVVLDRGRVVEDGTHAALVAAGGAYARIHAAQRRAGVLGDRP